MVFISERDQLVKGRFRHGGEIFTSEDQVNHPHVKTIELKDVEEKQIRRPKVLSSTPDGSRTLLYSILEGDIMAFYEVILRDGRYTLQPIAVKDAEKLFQSCPPECKRQRRFPELIESPLERGAKLGDIRETGRAISEIERERQQSIAKLRKDISIGDHRAVWEGNRSKYPGLSEDDFDSHGYLKL